MMEEDEKRSIVQIVTVWLLGLLAVGCAIAAFDNPQQLIVAMICAVFALCVWYN